MTVTVTWLTNSPKCGIMGIVAARHGHPTNVTRSHNVAQQDITHLATIHITLEPSAPIEERGQVLDSPSRFAVWLTTRDGGMQLYGVAPNRLEAQVYVNEISEVLGVARQLEV